MTLTIEEQRDAAGRALTGATAASNGTAMSDEDDERGDGEVPTLTPGYGPVSGRLFPSASSGTSPFRGPTDVNLYE